MVHKSFILFFLLLLSIYSVRSEKPQYLYSFNSDLNEGISQLSVRDIFEDSRGYLWFATKNGLNRFNGKEYIIYRCEDGNEQSLSDNHITSLKEDHYGNLWIGTVHGLNRFDLHTNRIQRYHTDNGLANEGILTVYVDISGRIWTGSWEGLNRYNREEDRFELITLNGELKNKAISTIYEDSTGKFWIGTLEYGVYVCDNKMNVVGHFSKESKNMQLSGNMVSSIYEDSHKQIWIGCKFNGLNKINLLTNEIHSFSDRNSGLSDKNVRCLIEWEGQLLIGTFNGVFALDIDTEQIVQVAGYDNLNKSLSHYSVYSFCVDRNQTLWVGTFAGGVNYLNKFANRFVLHNPENLLNIRTGIYGMITYESASSLWIATEGYGLLNYNNEKEEYNYYRIDPSADFTFNTNIIKAVLYENGSVWCGTTRGEIYQFDIKTRKFSLFYKYPVEQSIYSIIRDKSGRLWVGGSAPGYSLTCFINGKPISSFVNTDGGEPFYFSSIRCLFEESDGVLLIGTIGDGLFRFDSNRKQLIQYSNRATIEKYRIPNNYISGIVRTQSAEIWISTYGGGIFRYNTDGAIRQITTTKQGLLDNNICMLVESCDQKLWMSTINGLSMFDPSTSEVRNYHRHNGIDIREFTLHSGIALPDGNLCFAGCNGFVTFQAKSMIKNDYVPPVVLEQLTVNNIPIKVGDRFSLLDKVLNESDLIFLKYNENNLSISYQSLNYIYSTQNQYAYKLEGYDTDWNYVKERNSAFYTNLSPGKYIFHVKASNNDGVWNEAGKSIILIVQPPWWKTWYAYLFYFLLMSAILYAIIYYANIKKNLEANLKLKQLEKQKEEEFHEAKIRLFTNFSHELRTPLMLIITPFEELIRRVDISGDLQDQLSIIYKSAKKLLLLVNQLMDLHKNQAGSMKLKVGEADVCEYIKEIYYAFNQIALTNQVKFTLDCKPQSIQAWFDKSLLEKVVFNLLSNAFKYTPAGASIAIEVFESTLEKLDTQHIDKLYKEENIHYLILKVKDSGRGIEEKEVDNIFTPFYQIPETSDINLSGTGIGLSLVYTIVQLHRGVIYVDRTEPKGSCFVVILPISHTAFTADQLENSSFNEIVEMGNMENIPAQQPVKDTKNDSKYKILLVEDDKEVRDYLKKCLHTEYTVIEAADGIIAYEKVIQDFPNLVLSDIMMPKRDGLELCSMIKNDIRVGHIPVILMTARSMVIHIKEGFLAGADDYIVKPFNMDVLLTRIRSLLALREQLKKIYGKRFSPEVMGIEVKSADERFSQKLFDVIEKNISSDKLDIELLCNEIGISRANLYRKLKSITELSPTELIRNRRLEIAARLLKDSDMNVSEVAAQLGFNSHSYFSNSFKSFYGYTPTEFLQMNTKSELSSHTPPEAKD